MIVVSCWSRMVGQTLSQPDLANDGHLYSSKSAGKAALNVHAMSAAGTTSPCYLSGSPLSNEQYHSKGFHTSLAVKKNALGNQYHQCWRMSAFHP
jgi:hypothetical protein